jgi:virulence factor
MLAHVDAVSLVTPTPFHFDLAKRCLDRGIHVLVEKPITETVEQAEILTKMAADSGLTVQVGHIERFNSAYAELKNVIQGMSILAVDFRRLSAYENSNIDVDVVLDLMIHDIDLALDLIGGDIASLNANGLTAHSNVVDHAAVQLGFQQGPLLTMTASRVTEQKIRKIEVTAADAFLECDLLSKSIAVHRRTTGELGEFLSNHNRGLLYRQESIVQRIHVPIFEPLFLELQHFTDCILDNEMPQVSAQHGLEALRLATTIQQKIYQQLIKVNLQQSNLPESVA